MTLDGGHDNALDAGYHERVIAHVREFKTSLGLRAAAASPAWV